MHKRVNSFLSLWILFSNVCLMFVNIQEKEKEQKVQEKWKFKRKGKQESKCLHYTTKDRRKKVRMDFQVGII